MHLTPDAAGTFAIAPTPFHDDGRIDTASIDRLTDFYRDAGCNGITVLGIDVSHRSLEFARGVARDRSLPASFRKGNHLTCDLGSAHDAAILTVPGETRQSPLISGRTRPGPTPPSSSSSTGM